MGNYLIIGGTKGIGLAITKKLLNQGEEVVAVSREVNHKLDSYDNYRHIALDITTEELTSSDLPDRIDGLVYCPGSIVLKPFRSLSIDQFQADYQVNVLGAVSTIKCALPGLKKSEGNPSIVLFSTVAVSQGMAFHASIAAAKGAVEGLTRSLAAELAPKIRVNCIAPSLTDTDLASSILSSDERREASSKRHPLQRYGQPDDIANAATYLLSQGASWVSGQVLHVDGGLSSLR